MMSHLARDLQTRAIKMYSNGSLPLKAANLLYLRKLLCTAKENVFLFSKVKQNIWNENRIQAKLLSHSHVRRIFLQIYSLFPYIFVTINFEQAFLYQMKLRVYIANVPLKMTSYELNQIKVKSTVVIRSLNPVIFN